MKTACGHLMPHGSICIMDLPALQTIAFLHGSGQVSLPTMDSVSAARPSRRWTRWKRNARGGMKIHAHDFCHLQHGYHPQIPEIIADLSPQVARVPSGVCIGENGRRMMEHRIASDGLSDHHRRLLAVIITYTVLSCLVSAFGPLIIPQPV